jgi:hypothetical protein
MTKARFTRSPRCRLTPRIAVGESMKYGPRAPLPWIDRQVHATFRRPVGAVVAARLRSDTHGLVTPGAGRS